MESEKSQPLQSTCWRPKKADKVLVLKPGGTRPKKNQCFSLSPKTRKYHLPSSTVKPSYSAFLFYSGPQLIRWGPPTLGREFPRWLSDKESACQYRRQGFDPWRRKWQSTPVFLPGESHGQKGLVGYSPWGCKESDMTEWLCTGTGILWKVICFTQCTDSNVNLI